MYPNSNKTEAIDWANKNRPWWGKHGLFRSILKRCWWFVVNVVIIVTSPIWVFPLLLFGLATDESERGVLWGDHILFAGRNTSISRTDRRRKQRAIDDYCWTLVKMGAADKDHAYDHGYIYIEDERDNDSEYND